MLKKYNTKFNFLLIIFNIINKYKLKKSINSILSYNNYSKSIKIKLKKYQINKNILLKTKIFNNIYNSCLRRLKLLNINYKRKINNKQKILSILKENNYKSKEHFSKITIIVQFKKTIKIKKYFLKILLKEYKNIKFIKIEKLIAKRKSENIFNLFFVTLRNEYKKNVRHYYLKKAFTGLRDTTALSKKEKRFTSQVFSESLTHSMVSLTKQNDSSISLINKLVPNLKK